tara:strand:- start:18737 stop:19474 length:738 start_codon:yes stop_codon:yes gene_type:complete
MSDLQLVHVVDDEESIRKSMSFLLRSARYRVQCWTSGVAFLKGASRAEPACVLLDIRMPEMDGLEVQAEMAAQGMGLPVIVLTGHGDVTMAVKAMKAGAVDFLEKPFDRQKLLDAITRAFAQIADADVRRDQTAAAQVQIAALTARERDVLEGLACGYPNKTIAFDLGISPRTVEVHRANLMAKLEVTNFADALRIAFAANLGSGPEWRSKYLGEGGRCRSLGDVQRDTDGEQRDAPHQEIRAQE